MEKSTFASNLLNFRQKKSLSQEALADKIGVKRTTITNYESGISSPDYEKLIEIAKILDVTIDELLLGSRAVTKTTDKPKKIGDQSVFSPISPVVVTVDEAGSDNIAMVDVRAAAGYPENINEPKFFRDLPAFKLPGGDFRNGIFRCFQVEGDSMSETIYPNDFVVGRYLDNDVAGIREGYIHVIVTRFSVLVKRILNRAKTKGKLILVSDNDLYPPQELDVDEILEIWLVKAKLSFYLPSKRGALEKRVTNLEADMEEIKSRIEKGRK